MKMLTVVGDVNSTLACAVVTSKISLDSVGSRPTIVHLEAGLRSFDRSMLDCLPCRAPCCLGTEAHASCPLYAARQSVGS